MFDLITNRHVKIWLGPLKLQNELRLRNLRNINPKCNLYLVYEPRLLSVGQNKFIQSLCAELSITLLNVLSDIVPKCTKTNELNLINDYNAAIQAPELGGNLAAASDILRFLSPVYRLGIYSDMDVLIDTSHLPEVIKVDRPLLFNLGSLSFLGVDFPAVNNDILVVVDEVAASAQIDKIQQAIHDGCRLYEPQNDAFSHLQAEYQSLPNHPNSSIIGSFASLPLSAELSRIAKGKSIGQTRAEIIRRTDNSTTYCEYYRLRCLYYTIISLGSDSSFDSKVKSHRSSLLRESVIHSTGPGVALVAFSEYKSYPTQVFIRDMVPHSLVYYQLDLHFQTGNKLPLHSGSVDLIKLAFGSKRTDMSWLQAGRESIIEYENKLLAIESQAHIEIASSTDYDAVRLVNNRGINPPETYVTAELNRLARLHLMQLAELQHQFAMNTLCNQPRSISFAACSNVNGTSVCMQTNVNFQAPSFFSSHTVPKDIHYSCQSSLSGEQGIICTTEVTQEVCDQSIVKGCSNQNLVPEVAKSATFGFLAAAIPESVGDALRLIGNVSQTQANYATQATNLIFIALTGSWFSAGMGMAAQCAGELAGLSKPNARVLGNTVSLAVNVAKNPCSSTLIATGVSLAAGKIGLWAEKKIAKTIEHHFMSQDKLHGC